jgi:hypothetical protein
MSSNNNKGLRDILIQRGPHQVRGINLPKKPSAAAKMIIQEDFLRLAMFTSER